MQDINLTKRIIDLNTAGRATAITDSAGLLNWPLLLEGLDWDLYAPLSQYMNDAYPVTLPPDPFLAETIYGDSGMNGVRVSVGGVIKEYITGWIPAPLHYAPLYPIVQVESEGEKRAREKKRHEALSASIEVSVALLRAGTQIALFLLYAIGAALLLAGAVLYYALRLLWLVAAPLFSLSVAIITMGFVVPRKGKKKRTHSYKFWYSIIIVLLPLILSRA